LCASTGREAEALTLLQQIADREDRLVPDVFLLPAEHARAAFLHNVGENYHKGLALICQHLGGSTEAARGGLGLVLRRKTLGVEGMAAPRVPLLEAKYPARRGDLRRWLLLSRQTAGKTVAGPGFEGPTVHERLLAAWRDEAEEVEAGLARGIP